MAEKSNNLITEEILENLDELNEHVDLRRVQMKDDLNDPFVLDDLVYQLWWNWADFRLYIISPTIETISPPIIIPPEIIPGTNQLEQVYPIHDEWSKLATSKSADMFEAGKSMYRLHMTIEKMIYLFIERMKPKGIDTQIEIEVAFGGHVLAQRKAFESIINLPYNVVVTNFNPGPWGERYLHAVKNITEKYGYPSEAPRKTYKNAKKT